MKKKLIASLIALTLGISLVGCSSNVTVKNDTSKEKKAKVEEKTEGKIKEGGNFIFSASTDPTSLNPFFQLNRVTFTVNNILYDPLFVQDGDKTRYYLAKDLKVSDDMLTYTLLLKDNLKWHDGKKITADDIVFSVKTVQDKNQNISSRDGFVVGGKDVKVTKKDDLTVEFKLSQVYTPFKASLEGFKPIPKHIFNGKKNIEKDEASTSKPVGSGPFKFKEWKKGEALTLARFDDYYGGKPHLDNVIFRIVSDKNSSKVAFQNGEITATYLSNENYSKFSKDQNFKTYTFDENMLNYLNINNKTKGLDKKEVRQAIAYALNKEELLKADSGTLDNIKPAYSCLTPQTGCYTDDVEKYKYDPEKAKELLKKSGISNLKININYMSGSETDKKLALLIQQQLGDIGIKVEPVGIDSETYFAKTGGDKPRDYDIVTNAYVMGTEPSAYYPAFETNNPFNASCYSNPKVDKLFKEAKIEVNEGKRKELYEKAQKIIANDVAIYPLDYSISKIGTVKNLGGIKEAKLVPIYMFEDMSKLYFTE